MSYVLQSLGAALGKKGKPLHHAPYATKALKLIDKMGKKLHGKA